MKKVTPPITVGNSLSKDEKLFLTELIRIKGINFLLAAILDICNENIAECNKKYGVPNAVSSMWYKVKEKIKL